MTHELETLEQKADHILALVKETRAEIEELRQSVARINDYLKSLRTARS